MVTKTESKAKTPIKSKEKNGNIGINVASIEPSSISALHETLMAILTIPNTDERTKQLALEVLRDGVTAAPTSISNCHIALGMG